MTNKTLRLRRPFATNDLQKESTKPLGETELLLSPQPAETLLAQIEKLLKANDSLSARFESLSDISVAVNSSLRPRDIVRVIVEKAGNSLSFDYCGLATLKDGGKEYVLRPLVWPSVIPSPGPQVLPVASGLPRFVLRNGKPLILIDLAEHPVRVRPTQLTGELPPKMGGSLLAAGVRSLMILPLNSGGRVLGYLSFGKTTPRYYNQDDLQLAYLFSTLLATALNNSRLYDAEVHRARQLQMLNEIGQTATSILESETLLSRVSPLVRVHFGYDVAKIGLLQGDEVVYAAAAQSIAGCPSPTEERVSVSRHGAPVGIAGLAAFSGRMVLVPNIHDDPRWGDLSGSLASPLMNSVLAIPMTARDRVLGVLHFESEKIDAFSPGDVSILQSLANQLGVALDNARLYGQLNDLFHGYMDPQVASTLLDNPRNAELGGQRRVITVLFADLTGFTSVSERVPPEDLLELLNSCLGRATDAILEQGGTIDKYMGDAVMALFNAPQDQPDHAWRAIMAAVDIQRRLSALAVTREEKLRFSVGLHTGEAVVGNIGSSSLHNYTAIGDTVNLAKRIQELAGPGQVLLSKETYEAALAGAASGVEPGKGNSARAAELDMIAAYRVGTTQIKGRSRPAVLYQVNLNTRRQSQPEAAGEATRPQQPGAANQESSRPKAQKTGPI